METWHEPQPQMCGDALGDQAVNFFAIKFYYMPSWHIIIDGRAPAPPPVVDLDQFSSVDAYQLWAGHWEFRPVRKEADRIVRWLQRCRLSVLSVPVCREGVDFPRHVHNTRGRHYLSFCLVSKIVGFWKRKISKIQNFGPQNFPKNFEPQISILLQNSSKILKYFLKVQNFEPPNFFDPINYTYFKSPFALHPCTKFGEFSPKGVGTRVAKKIDPCGVNFDPSGSKVAWHMCHTRVHLPRGVATDFLVWGSKRRQGGQPTP